MNEIYQIDLIIEKSKINREAFYDMMQLLKITDRKIELKVLNFIINTKAHDMLQLSELLKQVKNL